MKSQQQETLIKTSCKNCVFAIYDNSTQTGCCFDRTKKFDITEAYDDNKEFFVVNRLCNYYRDKSWGYSLDDKSKVESESATSFDILINYNSLSEQEINHIINLINSNQYYKNKVKFTLFHAYEDDDKIKRGLLEIVESTKENYSNLNISVCYIRDAFLSTVVAKSKNDFHIIIDNQNMLDFNIDLLQEIDKCINVDLQKSTYFKRGSFEFVHNFLFKSHCVVNEIGKYDDRIQSIKEMSQNNNLFIEI